MMYVYQKKSEKTLFQVANSVCASITSAEKLEVVPISNTSSAVIRHCKDGSPCITNDPIQSGKALQEDNIAKPSSLEQITTSRSTLSDHEQQNCNDGDS